MRVKSMLIFIVLNIFLMLFSSVMFEYIDLEKRLNNITTVINEAGEAATNVSTASEELFSASYLKHETSYGVTTAHCPIHKNKYTKVATVTSTNYTNKKLSKGKTYYYKVVACGSTSSANSTYSTYALAYYYCCKGKIPETQAEFNDVYAIAREMTTEDVYEFLYGESGTEFDKLAWANKNNSVFQYTKKEHLEHPEHPDKPLRRMNTADSNACRALGSMNQDSNYFVYNDFELYLKSVYDAIYTSGYIKTKSNDYNSNYTLSNYSYPVLMNMGLRTRSDNLDSIFYENTGVLSQSPVSHTKKWNDMLDKASNETNDYFTGSFHWGKTRQFGAGQTSSKSGVTGNYSKYFLTPNTLGVTYVPLSVVKPNFIGLLKTKVQLNKVSGGDGIQKGEIQQIVTESIGCIDTDVYDKTQGVVANESEKHHVSSTENIINDGDIEYDLNSVRVKVEYFDCDFYNDNDEINQVVSRIEGAVPNWKKDDSNYGKSTGLFLSQNENLHEIINRLKATDTSSNIVYDKDGKDGRGKRLVAKVTFRIKVHIPYHSSILQLMCHKDNNSAHYDIRRFIPNSNDVVREDPNANHADMNKSGVWYQYTTYYSVTR